MLNIILLASFIATRTTSILQIPPPKPAAFPPLDQTIMISGSFLTDPLVVDALAHVQSVVSAAILAIPVSIYNSTVPNNPTYKGDPVANCYWPAGQCTRLNATPDFKPDIVTCPNANDWGLTFDDGPTVDAAGISGSPQLLSALAAANLKATFFMVGTNVIAHPDIALQAYQAGHQIAIHTWTHHPLTSLTNVQIVAEIKYGEAAIFKTTGIIPVYFRPPYGDMDDRARAIVSALGYRNIYWTTTPARDSRDTAGGTTSAQADAVAQSILSWYTPQPGFISLNHDINPYTAGISVSMINSIKNASSFPLKSQPVGQCQGLKQCEYYSYGAGSCGSATTTTTAVKTNVSPALKTASLLLLLALLPLLWVLQ